MENCCHYSSRFQLTKTTNEIEMIVFSFQRYPEIQIVLSNTFEIHTSKSEKEGRVKVVFNYADDFTELHLTPEEVSVLQNEIVRCGLVVSIPIIESEKAKVPKEAGKKKTKKPEKKGKT